MKRLFLVSLLFAAFALPASADGIFQISSPAFKDGDVLPSTFLFNAIGSDGTACGGENQSPPLAWTNAPAGTQSFAIMMFDPDGGHGQGVTHWLTYNIPPATTSVAQGAATPPNAFFTGGSNQFGQPVYRGSCPPKGDGFHHYVITVYALDLPPALPPALNRAAFLAAINMHVLRASTIVGRVAR
jgi:hypothetical protein